VHSLTDRITAVVEDRFRGNWAAAARACGLHATTVQKLKEGGDPRATTLSALAAGLGVSVGWLIDGDRVAEDAAGYAAERPAEALARYREATRQVLAACADLPAPMPPAQAEALIDWLADGPALPAQRVAALVRICTQADSAES